MMIVLLMFMLFLSSCSRVTLKKEFVEIKNKTKQITGAATTWQQTEKEAYSIKKNIQGHIQLGITRKEAISFALQNNPDLQAAFEQLGIAKSDLKNAGLFSNPYVQSVFRLPYRGDKANIEADISMRVSDFWQVPIRRNLAEDELEITTLAILHLIMQITRDVKIAYDTCLYMHAKLILAQDILNKIIELRDRISYRQKFGYENDLARYLSEAMVGKRQVKVIEFEALLKNAFVHLHHLLGLIISYNEIKLTNSLAYDLIEIPSLQQLKQYALKNRPELQIAQTKIDQAKHELSLEKARVLDEVRFGVSYKKDFEREKGWGPSIAFSLPIFNTNKALITRARFKILQTKKIFRAEKMAVLEELYQIFETIKATGQEMDIYKNTIFPSNKKAIIYAHTYFNQMQLNKIVLLESMLKLYEMEETYLDTQFKAAQLFANLEKAVAKKLT